MIILLLRTPWANARKRFFSSGCNKTSLDIIEGAAFMLVLDDDEFDYNEVSIYRTVISPTVALPCLSSANCHC